MPGKIWRTSSLFLFYKRLNKKKHLSLDQDVVTLANIDLNNNLSDNDSKIDDSKEEKLKFSLNTYSDGKSNQEDDSNTFMEIAWDEPNFIVEELLNSKWISS